MRIEWLRRLSFWNKWLAVVGSIASIIGLVLYFFPSTATSQLAGSHNTQIGNNTGAISQQAGSHSTQIGNNTGTVIVNPSDSDGAKLLSEAVEQLKISINENNQQRQQNKKLIEDLSAKVDQLAAHLLAGRPIEQLTPADQTLVANARAQVKRAGVVLSGVSMSGVTIR